VLRGVLEIVLEFSVLAGEVYRGRVEEYEAAVLMGDLFEGFCAKMGTLVSIASGICHWWLINLLQRRVLKAMVEKGDNGRSVEGDMVHRLLVRFEMSK